MQFCMKKYSMCVWYVHVLLTRKRKRRRTTWSQVNMLQKNATFKYKSTKKYLAYNCNRVTPSCPGLSGVLGEPFTPFPRASPGRFSLAFFPQSPSACAFSYPRHLRGKKWWVLLLRCRIEVWFTWLIKRLGRLEGSHARKETPTARSHVLPWLFSSNRVPPRELETNNIHASQDHAKNSRN